MTYKRTVSALFSSSLAAVMTILAVCSTPITADASDKNPASKWIESDIAGNVTSDTNVSLKDDFNTAVSKKWLSSTSIPEGYTGYSAFSEADDVIRQRKITLIKDDSLKSHDATLVKTLYSLTGDWQSRNDAGVSPAQKYIDCIKSIDSIDSLTDYITDETRNPLFTGLSLCYTTASTNDATKYTVGINEPVYFLSYPEDYTDMSESGQLNYDYAEKQSLYMLKRFGYSDSEASDIFNNAIKFEGMMAPYLYTSAEQSSSDFLKMTNNTWTLDQIRSNEGDFPLADIITKTGYGNSTDYLVINPDFVCNFGSLYKEQNLELIKDYLLAHYACYLINKLDRSAYEAQSDIKHSIYGGSGLLSEEDYCTNAIDSYLACPLDNLYIQKYCTKEMKDKVNECGEEVRDYYREMLKNETWLSEATRTAAIDKLNRMTIHSVIPEKTVDYSSLELKNAKNGGSFLDAILSIARFETQLDKSHINAKVDPDLWDSQTSEVNAYYDPSKNAVYFLAGQLVPPLLDDENNYEEFLALVGSTFGHEISHAFDTNGAQYDAYGNLKNWWTDADQAAFQDRTQKVVDYLDSITPFSDKPDLHIDGELVKTEYIADLVSFKPLFAIAEKHPGFNYDLFFQTYSVQWRLLSSQENEISQAQNDEHPLNYLRVNAILPQYQQFYDTYGIMPGDGMYIDQDDRLEVW